MTMANKYLIYIVTLLVSLSSFSACNMMEDEFHLSNQVRLKASLSSALLSTYTKAEGEIKSNYADTLHIGMAKVIGNGGDFKHAENVALKATMSAPSENYIRDIEFNQFQGFPDATNKVHYVGWYPYKNSTYTKGTDSTSVQIPIPVAANTDMLYSDVASGTRLDGFNTLGFRHALVKYSVWVYATDDGNSGDAVAQSWGSIRSVEIEQMPAFCNITLPESSSELPSVYFKGDQVLKRDAPLAQLPVGFSKAKELTYFLAGSPEDNILRIKVITQKDGVITETKQTLSIARDFQIGKHYKIYLRFTTHGIINADAEVGEWAEYSDPIDVNTNTGVDYDLSETHTANSYVVSAAYSYCFNATVRGNGYTGVAGIPGVATDIYKVGNPVKAEIVWTDLVSKVNENLDNYFTLLPTVVEGRVFFTVKPQGTSGRKVKEGNVLIGVRDADNQMLWTWHIWLTDRPVEQGYKNGFTVQDRDLGATAYNPNDENGTINGFYYQWGRPTPLPLARTVYRPVYDNVTGEWKSNEVVTIGTNQNNVAVINRVKSPTDFFTQKATSTDGKTTKSLWGWRTETDEYAKTIYDPCPPGYRVPSIKLWRDLVIHDSNGDGKRDANLITKDGKYVAAHFQVDVNLIDVYYPMTGYYELPTSPKNVYSGAYMWAATFKLGTLNDLSDDAPYALDFTLDTQNQQNELDEMLVEPELSYYALPVRCISRMSKAHVTDLSDYQTANSYIISKEGFYKFKATVRGNGIGQLVSPGSTSTIVLREQLQSVDITNQLVKVAPLWWKPAQGTSVGEPDIVINGTPDADGYVTFELKQFSEGNLILAGYDAKDEIIWSWHLWLTDEPTMMKSNSFVVMDRNLGATFAPKGTVAPSGNDLYETYGLYYQWGRKDPFPVETASTVFRYDQTMEFDTLMNAALKTVENSVRNPMRLHLASKALESDGIFNNKNFFDNASTSSISYEITEDDNKLANQCFSNMVHPENVNSLWGYSAASGYGVTTTKTMYDPCPPGYIVAHYLVWTNTNRDGSDANNYYSNLDTFWRKHYSNVGEGFFTSYYEKFDHAWYPFGGYLNGKDGNLENRGVMGIFHTSTPAGNGSRSLAYNSTYSGQIVDHSYRGLPSSFAYPVRCQKE